MTKCLAGTETEAYDPAPANVVQYRGEYFIEGTESTPKWGSPSNTTTSPAVSGDPAATTGSGVSTDTEANPPEPVIPAPEPPVEAPESP